MKNKMDNNELNRIADLIWMKLNCSENLHKNRADQTELIKPALIELSSDSMKVGRTQILNHLKDEIKGLESS